MPGSKAAFAPGYEEARNHPYLLNRFQSGTVPGYLCPSVKMIPLQILTQTAFSVSCAVSSASVTASVSVCGFGRDIFPGLIVP